jgi:transcriptional regulator with XRE-family HTH domain
MTTPDQTYASAIVANIMRARAKLRLSQKALGNRMKALGFSWRQQIVNAVETGERRLQVDELLGLALALETTLQELLSPSDSDRETSLAIPSGETVSADYVTRLVYGQDGGAVTWTDDKPEFGPESRRTSLATRTLGQMLRGLSSGRDTVVRFEDPSAGTTATFTWKGVKPPFAQEGDGYPLKSM